MRCEQEIPHPAAHINKGRSSQKGRDACDIDLALWPDYINNKTSILPAFVYVQPQGEEFPACNSLAQERQLTYLIWTELSKDKT